MTGRVPIPNPSRHAIGAPGTLAFAILVCACGEGPLPIGSVAQTVGDGSGGTGGQIGTRTGNDCGADAAPLCACTSSGDGGSTGTGCSCSSSAEAGTANSACGCSASDDGGSATAICSGSASSIASGGHSGSDPRIPIPRH
jgi:hypothetical protein